MRTPKIEAPKQFDFNPNQKNGEEIIRETREYELITPLFGGGAETKKADEVSVIRATEIRGHLRFWWRATRGGQFNGDVEKMKETEDAIFGSTERSSALQIEVILEADYEKREEDNSRNSEPAFTVEKYYKRNPRNGREEEKFKVNDSDKIAPYAAFPLLPDQHQRKIDQWESEKIKVNATFKIDVSYPKELKILDEKGNIVRKIDSSKEIRSAFWAWEMFGGIGARTRRGFGALKLLNHEINGGAQPIDYFESSDKLRDKAKEFISDGSAPKGVPHLKKDLRFACIDFDVDAIEIWKDLLEGYKSFRQQREGTKRSKWNEPEAIRKITGQRLNIKDRDTKETIKHHQPIQPGFEKFPRARFGMPLNFQFKDSGEKNFHDPRKTSLVPTDKERFSSPLILRPIARQNGKAIGIALILENEADIDEIGLTLETQEGTKQSWNKTTKGNKLLSKLEPNEAKEIKVATERTKERLGSEYLLGDEIDVLQAFLNYLGR
jgi:CRISPR-associated protein Cmr1